MVVQIDMIQLHHNDVIAFCGDVIAFMVTRDVFHLHNTSLRLAGMPLSLYGEPSSQGSRGLRGFMGLIDPDSIFLFKFYLVKLY